MASLVAQMVKNLPAMLETWVQFLGQEDPLGKEMAIHSIFLPRESQGQRSLAGYSQSVVLQESDTTERVHFHCNKTEINKRKGNKFINMYISCILGLPW